MKNSKRKKYVVSACLAGIDCRYDCKSNSRVEIKKLVKSGQAIPVCPEQLGGLTTPRMPAEQQRNKVVTKAGEDVTKKYRNGAREAMKIVKLFGATEALLKSKSPMCGCGKIYDGTFTKTLIKGEGIFTKILKKKKIKVRSIE